jgi:2-polyprenyl-6-methoxyphenol hydroxylase-like FAD-dependent oxidoreductase
MTRQALVAGGSIGGLFAAAALIQRGWDVQLVERSRTELSGRGAGIVTHAELIAALEAVGAGTDSLGVAVENRVALDQQQSVVQTVNYPQIVTSWDRIHQVLRAILPEGRMQLGRSVTGYETDANGARAVFDDGSQLEVDLLVGADGFRSALRAQMHPNVQPTYAGYVVWRVVTDEAHLSPAAHDLLFSDFGMFAPYGSQVLGYPIAGPGNDLRPGHRRYNFVWYRPMTGDALADALTDASGKRHGVSIPPPLVRDDVIANLTEEAKATLPKAFSEILERGERPFFTPIYDHWSPSFGEGCVALAGDAACVARPHVGMGVTKAAEDALALARHVTQASDVATGVQSFSTERAPASREAYLRGQALGALMFEGSAKANPDGGAHPEINRILRETAAILAS